MKSYGNLYESFLSNENIKLAIINSSENKRDRPLVKAIYENPDLFAESIRNYADGFENEPHYPVEIFDGIKRKRRKIIVPAYTEQVVHHMFIQILKPIIMKGMYKHSYGSVPGVGSYDGAKAIKKWINHDRKNVKYCLKMDIFHFYPTADQQVLKNLLRRTIRDERFLNVGCEIVDVVPEGLPLGFYTSPWFANWLLQPLDYFIKQKLRAPHYIRYMDDMVIFSSNKKKLSEYRRQVEVFLEEKLHLRLRRDWQIFRFDYLTKDRDTGEMVHKGRPLDYMGLVFYRDRVILRESIMLNATRLAKKISKQEKPNIYSLKRMMAYKGYIDHTDTYNMYLNYIKPYVTFQYCRRRISRNEKRRNKEIMTGWKTSRSTVRPEELDITSSKTTIYVRKNIREVETDDGTGGGKVKMYEYEEKQMTKAEFVAYADILETAKRALQNEADVSSTQDALLEVDSATDARMTEIENCILELDGMTNK